MTKDQWDERRRGLEEGFFNHQNQVLLENLRKKNLEDASKKELTEATGIKDGETLDRLIHAGIRVETLAAVNLIPFVYVAWADEDLADKEKEALLKLAHDKGIVEGSPAHKLLANWLDLRPDANLFESWKQYISTCKKEMQADDFLALKSEVTHRAEVVAKAAGGIFGLSNVSPYEKVALGEILKAFA